MENTELKKYLKAEDKIAELKRFIVYYNRNKDASGHLSAQYLLGFLGINLDNLIIERKALEDCLNPSTKHNPTRHEQ